MLCLLGSRAAADDVFRAAPTAGLGSDLDLERRVPALPSDDIRDAVYVRGELLLATSRGLYALALGGGADASTPGVAELGSVQASPIWRTVLGRTAVTQLAIDGPIVWIASEEGLWSWDFRRNPVRVPEVGGVVVGVVATGDGSAWAASEDGLFLRTSADPRWGRSDALPERDVAALHVTREASASTPGLQAEHPPEIWAATPGALWRLEPDGGFRRLVAGVAEGWWELRGAARSGSSGEATWLAVPDGLWLVRGARVERLPLASRELTALAPTADAQRVVAVGGGSALCVSADRKSQRAGAARALGILRGADPRQSWLLVPQGIERLPCGAPSAERALEAANDPTLAIVAAEAANDRDASLPREANAPETGLVRAAGGPDPKRIDRLLPTAVEVERLHAAVLEYLDLTPSTLRALERRTRRRGLWPELRVGMGMDAMRARELARDQSFTSGAIRDLSDMLRERQRDSAIDVELIWRLGERADPTDELAISRERRERIELREQVLERVDQIFFERARILARLAQEPDMDAQERLELEIRARELAASLDAWTGGEFSRNDLRSSKLGGASGAQPR